MTAFSWVEAIFGRQRAVAPEGGLTIGHPVKGAREPLLIPDERLRDHIAISGRQGMGIQLLLEQLLRQQTAQGRGWIYVDPFADQDMLERTAQYARELGRGDEFYVLDLDRTEKSNSYSLLHEGAPDERAARVLRALPPANDPGAEFYRQQAHYLLTTIFAAAEAAGKSIGLADLTKLLWHLDDAAVEAQLLEGVPEGIARASLVTMLDAYRQGNGAVSAERLRNVAGGVAGRLAVISQSGIPEQVLDDPAPELVFSDILKHNKMCFVKLPVMEKDSLMQAVTRMVLHDVFSAFDARAAIPRRARTPFLCLMESFDAYGLHMRTNAWSRARRMHVCMVPVIRTDLDHLAAIDGDALFDFMANTFTKLWFWQAHGALAGGWLDTLEPGALDTLQAGECILNIGPSAVRARLAPHHLFEGAPPEQGGGFTPRAMVRAAPHRRLAVAAPEKAEVSP